LPMSVALRPPPACPLVSSRAHLSPAPASPLSLHDALPIFFISASAAARKTSGAARWPTKAASANLARHGFVPTPWRARFAEAALDRKSTRLNSSHGSISYAVFCLKKKNKTKYARTRTERQE